MVDGPYREGAPASDFPTIHSETRLPLETSSRSRLPLETHDAPARDFAHARARKTKGGDSYMTPMTRSD
eukprot:4602502-Pyramimonas_sp.AAC.1